MSVDRWMSWVQAVGVTVIAAAVVVWALGRLLDSGREPSPAVIALEPSVQQRVIEEWRKACEADPAWCRSDEGFLRGAGK